MKIEVIATGGTIDKVYFDALSDFKIGDSQVPDVFEEANVGFEFSVCSLMKKDSLELTDADRMLIRERVLQSDADKVLITHGTDTMADTGRALVGIEGKTIVLTGSMQPILLRKTDAVFNLGFAVCALTTLPAGVYVAMNGQVFDPNHAKKDRANHRFVALDDRL
jgi:L-asparaginase